MQGLQFLGISICLRGSLQRGSGFGKKIFLANESENDTLETRFLG
jgi:hypothetical protein